MNPVLVLVFNLLVYLFFLMYTYVSSMIPFPHRHRQDTTKKPVAPNSISDFFAHLDSSPINQSPNTGPGRGYHAHNMGDPSSSLSVYYAAPTSTRTVLF